MGRPARHADGRVLVLACGALVNELQAIIAASGFEHVDLECLPAKLHNRPALIAGAARERIDRLASEGRSYGRILLGYAECGTAGALDELRRELAGPDGSGPQVERVPGDHCYEFFAGAQRFDHITQRQRQQ